MRAKRHSIYRNETKQGRGKKFNLFFFFLSSPPLQLGEGGFACVYGVKREGQEGGRKLFALKRVVASSRECLEAARREVAAARAAAEFSSSPPSPRAVAVVGLLPLLASEEKRGRTTDGKATVEVLLLFPFCAGGSLADVVVEVKKERAEGEKEGEWQQRKKKKREEILSIATLLRVFADVAEGLSKLHSSKKLGHFDVKPHNIFLLSREGEEEDAPSWRAALGDWGSARRVPIPLSSHAGALAVCEEAERSTTAAYRPPELWDPLHFAAAAAAARGGGGKEREVSGSAGKEREVSGSADIWSLGACLFACLGDGRSPSEVAAGAGGGGSLSLAACSGRVEWPLSSLPAPPLLSVAGRGASSSSSASCFVPSSAVKALVEQCLSLDPEKRPSAAAFAAEARSLAEGIEKRRTKS